MQVLYMPLDEGTMKLSLAACDVLKITSQAGLQTCISAVSPASGAEFHQTASPPSGTLLSLLSQASPPSSHSLSFPVYSLDQPIYRAASQSHDAALTNRRREAEQPPRPPLKKGICKFKWESWPDIDRIIGSYRLPSLGLI